MSTRVWDTDHILVWRRRETEEEEEEVHAVTHLTQPEHICSHIGKVHPAGEAGRNNPCQACTAAQLQHHCILELVRVIHYVIRHQQSSPPYLRHNTFLNQHTLKSHFSRKSHCGEGWKSPCLPT